MNVGLFFGSFNPVHTGHLIIANYVRETSGLDKVWFVVSPQNPLKEKSSLLKEYDRLHLINLAIHGNENLFACDIEFKLPKPSYTIDTLIHLEEKYPQHKFSLIMGGDNLNSLHKWKNHEILLQKYPIIVYNRKDSTSNPFPQNKNISFLEAPLLDISATFIRENIKNGISMQYFLPDSVWNYIQEMRLYAK